MPTILITGGGGYLGSVIAPMLLERGYNVKIIDRFFWGKNIFAPYFGNKNLTLIEADTRFYLEDYLKNTDAVIDLAALSNDPAAEINPKITMDINCHARVRTAEMARKMGVKKYILASSCSVYGFNDNIADESSKTNPLTTYAKASCLAEEGILKLAQKNFCVTALRQGTLYGLSPRMRFDLALNTMALSVFKKNSVSVEGGQQWRPIVHVKDSANAFIKIAEADPKKINREIFNVGGSGQNFQIKNLALLIAKAINPKCQIITGKEKKDARSYQVSFEKIKNTIEYRPEISPEAGAKEVFNALKTGSVKDEIHTKTIDWYKHLLSKDPCLLDAKKIALPAAAKSFINT